MTTNTAVSDLTVSDLSTLLIDASNKELDEFNAIYDKLEEANKTIEQQQQRIEQDRKLLQKQELVIQTAVTIKQKSDHKLNILRAQNKEFMQLNPRRLAKVCKEQRKSRIDIKKKLQVAETARKEANKTIKTITNASKLEGAIAFHYDPETKNAMRILPGLLVSKINEFDGVPGSPVIEFICHSKGVTRQGTLLNDGMIGWANTDNTVPDKTESAVALDYLKTWCKTNKVKIGKK